MAKKPPTALDAIKALPKRKSGAVPFVETITKQQQKEYLEIVAYLRTLPDCERPTMQTLLRTIRDNIGVAPCANTLRDHLRNEQPPRRN